MTKTIHIYPDPVAGYSPSQHMIRIVMPLANPEDGNSVLAVSFQYKEEALAYVRGMNYVMRLLCQAEYKVHEHRVWQCMLSAGCVCDAEGK